MTFSLYTFCFLVIVTVLFYIVRKDLRALILLIASWSYVASLDIRSMAVLVIHTFFTYLIGCSISLLISKDHRQCARLLTYMEIIILTVSLLCMKYMDFGFGILHISDERAARLLLVVFLPLGFSYYYFQSVSYITDIYTGRIEAEKNPVILALYLSFFPKFISGPIERPEHIFSQFKKLSESRLYDVHRLSSAFSCILYGFFLKIVIADRIDPYTNMIFSDQEQFSSLWLIIGSLLYTIQIYCDFAGYSSVAVGIARIFGVELTHNFIAPYLSENISVFWRRWHISLGAWLREYIYIPLGGNRRGIVRQCLNIFIVFVVCGIWHGNSTKFIVWGVLHGLYSVINILFSKKIKGKKYLEVLSGLVTFFSVSFAWIFFAVPRLTDAFSYIRRMFSVSAFDPEIMNGISMLGADRIDIIILIGSILLLMGMDIITSKASRPFPEEILSWKYGWRYITYFLMIVILLLFGSYGPEFDARQFMYMEF